MTSAMQAVTLTGLTAATDKGRLLGEMVAEAISAAKISGLSTKDDIQNFIEETIELGFTVTDVGSYNILEMPLVIGPVVERAVGALPATELSEADIGELSQSVATQTMNSLQDLGYSTVELEVYRSIVQGNLEEALLDIGYSTDVVDGLVSDAEDLIDSIIGGS